MKTEAWLGLDVGSISTKGAVIDRDNNLLAESYLWTRGNPLAAVKTLLQTLESRLPEDVRVCSAGTTGSARRLAGAMVQANVVKNEITAHAVGTLSYLPDTRTIFEIGGQDSKLILLEEGIVTDYAMNTLCAAGTGAFLSAQAKRLDIAVEDLGEIALRSKQPVKIAARCTVFAETDLVHKAQIGHSTEDLVAGLCAAVAQNYLGNLAKGKALRPPIVFQGGVSKNSGVVRAFEEATGEIVRVPEHSHLMGALGAAVLSRSAPTGEESFDFQVGQMAFTTESRSCEHCGNQCEVVCLYSENDLIDAWGNRCEKGAEREVFRSRCSSPRGAGSASR